MKRFRNSIDYIDILSKTKNIRHVVIKNKLAINWWELKFKNVSIKIMQSDHSATLYLFCKEFTCNIDFSNFKESFWLNYWEFEENEETRYCFLHLKHSELCRFSDYKVIDDYEEIKNTSIKFPTDLDIQNNKLEIIIYYAKELVIN